MKKMLYVVAAMVAVSFAACGGNANNAATDEAQDSVAVVEACEAQCDSCCGKCDSCAAPCEGACEKKCGKAEGCGKHECCGKHEGCPKHAAE